MADIVMSCFPGYTLSSLGDDRERRILRVERDGVESIIKFYSLDQPYAQTSFTNERNTFARLKGLGITPELYASGVCQGKIGYLHMEKFGDSLADFSQAEEFPTELQPLTKEEKDMVKDQVTDQVNRMHDANIGHGDLNGGNVLIKRVNGGIQTAITDFEYAYDIDTGRNDPSVLEWMEIMGFGGRVDEFVDSDLTQWHVYL
jgi:predicted Ser/Thr protein kinase